MTEISELEYRISQALDRIGAGIAALEKPAPAPEPPSEDEDEAATAGEGEVVALRELLDAERGANAQLEERLKVLKDRQSNEGEDLKREVETLRTQVEETHTRNRILKKRLEEMRRAFNDLRASVTDGQISGEALNAALAAELAGLSALREADRVELDTLLGALEPLVKETGHA